MVRRPSTDESSSSSTSVTADSMTAGLAPRRVTETDTIGGSTSGNSRTDSWRYPMMPNSTRPALNMAARTGRRIERSERIIELLLKYPASI